MLAPLPPPACALADPLLAPVAVMFTPLPPKGPPLEELLEEVEFVPELWLFNPEEELWLVIPDEELWFNPEV